MLKSLGSIKNVVLYSADLLSSLEGGGGFGFRTIS